MTLNASQFNSPSSIYDIPRSWKYGPTRRINKVDWGTNDIQTAFYDLFFKDDVLHNPSVFTTSDIFKKPIFKFFDYGGVLNDPIQHTWYTKECIQASRQFENQQLEDNFLLKTPRVTENTLSELVSLGTGNYIDWLSNSTLYNIWKQNEFDNMPSRSLLFLLLRQSKLLTYRKEAWNILEKTGVFDKQGRAFVGTVEGSVVQLDAINDQRILTKWDLLFKSLDQIKVEPELSGALNHFATDDFKYNIIPFNWSNLKLSEFLEDPMVTHSDIDSIKSVTEINQLEDAFLRLKDIPTAELDRLLSEHIDLCSYRLDAWNYGMVNKKLLEQRNVETSLSRNKGSYLGAYGWLMDVRPKSNVTPINVNVPGVINPALEDANGKKIIYDENNLGFIQTPSMAHAITSAILRSGFVSERLAADDHSFSINLTSERVKRALELFDGVRNGQSLSELLGYEFEKGVMERHTAVSGLAPFITFFRKVFPLVNDETAITPVGQSESIRPNNVCDGIDLLNSFQDNFKIVLQANPQESIYKLYNNGIVDGDLTSWLGSIPHPVAGITIPSIIAGVGAGLMIEIDRLANSMDAVGDVAMTEGIYQIAGGNQVRSAAVMEALTEGKNLPELEVLNTPRTGFNISHRLVGLMDQTVNTSQFSSPKALVEPKLNKWAEDIVKDFIGGGIVYSKIECTGTYNDGTVDVSQAISLSDIGVDINELLSFVEDNQYATGLIELAKDVIRNDASITSIVATGGIPKSVAVDINLDLAQNAGSVSFNEVISLLAAIKSLTDNSRYLSPEDFVGTEDSQTSTASVPAKFDITELQNRISNASLGTSLISMFNATKVLIDLRVNGLVAAKTTSIAALAGYVDSNWFNIMVELNAVYKLDIDIAQPKYALGDKSNVLSVEFEKIATTILEQVESVKAVMDKRLVEYNQIITNSNAVTNEEFIVECKGLVEALLGRSFKLIPVFHFNHYPDLEQNLFDQIDKQYNAGNPYPHDLLLHANPVPSGAERNYIMDDWLYSLSRVEERLDEIETIRMFADGSSVSVTLAHGLQEMRPIQFPVIDQSDPLYGNNAYDDYWVGVEYPDTYKLLEDKLSIVVMNPRLLEDPQSASYIGMYAGLFIHNWDEFIPSKEETTGVTFHYDQPNAKPPQNLLLAVHSGNASNNHWQIEDMLYTLLDTIEMSKVRMVEPDHFKSATDSNGEIQTTQKFEIFKWMLPAVVGEMTPHNIERDNNDVITMNDFQGESDSIQQVSFEYNPKGDSIPTATTGGGTPISTGNGSVNLQKMYPSQMLQNLDIQAFLTQQNSLAQITNTIAQLQNNSN